MARFNSAKMNLASEVGGINAFERKYNALIDLLDQAYIAESLIDGTKIKVVVSPKDGLAIYQDDEKIAGIGEVGGEYGLISQFLTSSPDADFYARVGDVDVGGVDYTGILGFLKSYSETTPVLYMTANYDSPTDHLKSKINMVGSVFQSDVYSTSEEFRLYSMSSFYPNLHVYYDGLNDHLALYADTNNYLDVSAGDSARFTLKSPQIYYQDTTGLVLDVRRAAFQYLGYDVWHEGNDGSGSTLDADMLDGREGWQYARGGVDSYSYATLNTPVNTLTNGFYRCSDGPLGWMHLINLNHQNADGYGAQIRIDYFNGDMYYRSSNALVFDSWHKVWDDGNLTPGDYLARSGGTMTGALFFSELYAPSTAGVYFDGYGNIWPRSGVDSGSFWNIRDSLGNVKFKFWLGKSDPVEMSGLTLTGDLTMSSNNLYASALYEGGTAISSKYLSIANVAVGSGTSNATGGADTNVSFGKTFASAPKVCANSINGAYTCRIKSVSTTGFVLVISGGSVTFNYIAVSA